jgi:hypothetical protein
MAVARIIPFGLLLILAPLVAQTQAQESPSKDTLPSTETIQAWIAQLGEAQWDKREEAERRLLAAGPTALPLLEEARNHPDPEVAARARRLWHKASRSEVGIRCLDASTGRPLTQLPLEVNFFKKQRGEDTDVLAGTVFEGITDAEGILPLGSPDGKATRFPPGRYGLRVACTGYAPFLREEIVLSGGTVLLEVPLHIGAQLLLKLTSSTPGPLPALLETRLQREEGSPPDRLIESMRHLQRTSPRGKEALLHWEGLPPGRYLLVVGEPGKPGEDRTKRIEVKEGILNEIALPYP